MRPKNFIDAGERFCLNTRRTHFIMMKTLALALAAAAAASVAASCCCQEQPMPPLKKMPKFKELADPDQPIILDQGKGVKK